MIQGRTAGGGCTEIVGDPTVCRVSKARDRASVVVEPQVFKYFSIFPIGAGCCGRFDEAVQKVHILSVAALLRLCMLFTYVASQKFFAELDSRSRVHVIINRANWI